LRQEQQPRAMHDFMDGGGRTASGTAVEEQLPGCAEAAYNPIAFPPLHLDVQVPRSTRLHGKDCSELSFCISAIHGGQMEEVEPRREHRSRSSCRSGCRGRTASGDLQGRDCSQQSFCISTVPGGQMQEVRATHDSMDGGGRTASGTAVEEQLPRRAGAAKHTTPWMEELEPCREQRSRTCESGHPWWSDGGRLQGCRR
jgi:hypothetical protein